ncbi:RteC domain-containing protein [Mucilaginibacter phyllosphaerae]
MINELARTSYEALLEELRASDSSEITEVQRTKFKLKTINIALDQLRFEVDKNSFSTDDEEIQFFKFWKPCFVGQYLFEQEIFKINLKLPENDKEALKNYYKDELSFLEKFNAKHQFLREYYLSDSAELDTVYFLRRSSAANPLWADVQVTDKYFSTPGDSIIARFMCNDRLKALLLNAIIDIDNTRNGHPSADNYLDLQWTGETISVVEIAYGFWLTGKFNKGKANLSQIVRWLEIHWGVSIDNVQRKFSEIANRKRLSPTKFLDEMKDAIVEKIESGNQ